MRELRTAAWIGRDDIGAREIRDLARAIVRPAIDDDNFTNNACDRSRDERRQRGRKWRSAFNAGMTTEIMIGILT